MSFESSLYNLGTHSLYILDTSPLLKKFTLNFHMETQQLQSSQRTLKKKSKAEGSANWHDLISTLIKLYNQNNVVTG